LKAYSEVERRGEARMRAEGWKGYREGRVEEPAERWPRDERRERGEGTER
jgi:hypothetical protein